MERIQEFYTIVLDGFDAVFGFAGRLLDINCFLAWHPQGVKFGELQMMARLLHGLRYSYIEFVSRWQTIISRQIADPSHTDERGWPASFGEVNSLVHEEGLKQASGLKDGCRHCGKVGHFRQDCWNLHPELRRRRRGKARKKGTAWSIRAPVFNISKTKFESFV